MLYASNGWVKRAVVNKDIERSNSYVSHQSIYKTSLNELVGDVDTELLFFTMARTTAPGSVTGLPLYELYIGESRIQPFL